MRAKVTHFCYFHNTPFHTHYLLSPATLRLLDLCNRIHRQVRGDRCSVTITDSSDPGIFPLYFPGIKKYICTPLTDTLIFAIARFFSLLITPLRSRACLSVLQHFHKLLLQSKKQDTVIVSCLGFSFSIFHIFLPNQIWSAPAPYKTPFPLLC